MGRISNREIQGATRWFLIGALYGLVLSVFAFFAAGNGHGCYVPFGAFSSPWGVFGEMAAIFGVIPLWSSIAAILALGTHRRFRALFVGCMVGHYAGLPVLLAGGAPFDDWGHSARVQPSVSAIGGLVYLAGQALLWQRFCRGVAERRDEPGHFQFTLKILLMAMFIIALPLACFVWPNPAARLASPYIAGTAAGLGFLVFYVSQARNDSTTGKPRV
ncbi:MAG TPA: hypothetical protein VGN42_14355 [Pirellulales bacterium]|nr:hypothetical protein [Pirellulales bacterium]